MAHGGNPILSKGYRVLTTYNTSAAGGVTWFRAVTLTSADVIDINGTSTARSLGIVQENLDQAKVATGGAIANVMLMGITKMYVAVATSIALLSRVAVGGSGATLGGAIFATTATHIPIGIVVGAPGTIAAGDLIDVLLTPGLPVL